MGFLRLTLQSPKRQEGLFDSCYGGEYCQTINDLRKLSLMTFNYREDLSSNNELVFVKLHKKSELSTQTFFIAYLYDRLVHSSFDRHLACPK